MANLNSLISFLIIYSSSLLLILFSCIPVKTLQAADSDSTECISYNDMFLNLASVRDILVRQEDTIVSCLIERSKYPANSKLYNKDMWARSGDDYLTHYIFLSESTQSESGRYLSEVENQFSNETLPLGSEPLSLNCSVLHPLGANCVTKNKEILDAYRLLLPNITVDRGDDGQYVATATADLACLQAFSFTINLGKFAAETKFRHSMSAYRPFIKNGNKSGLRDLLTNKTGENQIVERVKLKAQVFGGSYSSGKQVQEYKVDPSLVSDFYNKTVISLTKDVEVDYLLLRLNASSSDQC